MRYACAAALIFLASSCIPEGALRKRAAFDLQCQEQGLEVIDLGGGTRGVTGCGRQATYVWVPSSGSWVMNSDTQTGTK